MKAIKTNLAVAELRKIIGQWRSRKITDSTLPKLLNLYLGLTPYMNQEQVYPIENFYDLSISIGFKNAATMIMAVKQCGAFGILPESNAYGMSAFYSPLWHEKFDTNSEPEKSECKADSAETFPETFPQNNIYKYISKESSSGEEVSPEGEKLPTSFSSKENFVTTPDSLADAKEFFHLVNESEEERAKILTPLIDRFQKQEGLVRNHACENLIYLVNELLVPYFSAQPTFRKTTHKGRLVWLSNLLKSAHGNHLINNAAKATRQKRQQAAQEQYANMRNNHPVSPFEWTDLESNRRFYDDPVEGTVLVPDNAPPRPSERAIWNVITEAWI